MNNEVSCKKCQDFGIYYSWGMGSVVTSECDCDFLNKKSIKNARRNKKEESGEACNKRRRKAKKEEREE